MIPLLAELMPAPLRTTGYSVAFSLATAVFGGFTPLVSTYLIQLTSDQAAPALWLTLAAVLSLVAAIAARRRVIDWGYDQRIAIMSAQTTNLSAKSCGASLVRRRGSSDPQDSAIEVSDSPAHIRPDLSTDTYTLHMADRFAAVG
jgi:hypothetical protein